VEYADARLHVDVFGAAGWLMELLPRLTPARAHERCRK
jgi:hypothetical protein